MQLVGYAGFSHTVNLFSSAGKRLSDTCFCLYLISFLVDSHKPDPAGLENDEKVECWGPEGMKRDGGGPWGPYDPRSSAT